MALKVVGCINVYYNVLRIAFKNVKWQRFMKLGEYFQFQFVDVYGLIDFVNENNKFQI